MTPMLGIMASQISGHLYTLTGNYDSIQTVTVGSGGQATVSFTSIPATYTHLQIRGSLKTANAANGTDLKMILNSDTAANYSHHSIYGNGANANVSAVSGASYIELDGIGSTTANVFNGWVCDILDYANVNKYKTTRTLTGFDTNGGGLIFLYSGNWRSTSAISRIDLTVLAGSNFSQYSSIALYGIK